MNSDGVINSTVVGIGLQDIFRELSYKTQKKIMTSLCVNDEVIVVDGIPIPDHTYNSKVLHIFQEESANGWRLYGVVGEDGDYERVKTSSEWLRPSTSLLDKVLRMPAHYEEVLNICQKLAKEKVGKAL